jgi:DNA-binding NtrC family response regulator
MEPIPQQPEALEHTVTVLLAEDEVLIRLDVAEELRRAGWKVIEVASADDAIDILNSPVIVDLVVTDVNMPGEANGLDLARWVRRERRNVKVVIMSGHFVPATEPEQAPPCDLFIPKPFLHSQLVEQLMPLLQSGKDGSE